MANGFVSAMVLELPYNHATHSYTYVVAMVSTQVFCNGQVR